MFGMRILSSVAGVALVALLLTGCLPPESTVTPTPQPSSTPVFASDEEALAAAEAAYAEYLAVSDAILNDGGEDPDRIDTVVTGDLIATEKDGFADFRESGYRSVGATMFDNVSLQRYEPSSAGVDVVRLYLCSDVSAVDVVDASGVSIVSPDRPERTAFEVGFDLADPSTPFLVLSSKEVWTGGGIC